MGIYRLLLMESPTDMFCRYTRWWVHRWMCHVTVRRSRFKSLGHSVGKIIWKKSTSSHRCNFPKNYIIRRWYGGYIPTESLYTDRITDKYFLSVYTVRIRDEIISVGKNYRRKNSVGNSDCFCRFSSSVRNCFLFIFIIWHWFIRHWPLWFVLLFFL